MPPFRFGPSRERSTWSGGEPDACLPAPRLCRLWPPGGASPARKPAPLCSPQAPPTRAHPLREEAWPGLKAGLCWGPGCLESVEAAQKEATEGGRPQEGAREARAGAEGTCMITDNQLWHPCLPHSWDVCGNRGGALDHSMLALHQELYTLY